MAAPRDRPLPLRHRPRDPAGQLLGLRTGPRLDDGAGAGRHASGGRERWRSELLGDLFLEPAVTPFEMVDDLVEEARRETPFVIVDFHGEATSEKVAMAWHLDGRVTAVFGTHTHIQTNDARVLPGGTAAITDAGMTGPHESVIGVKSELAIKRMLTGMPVRFETAEGDVRIEGALVETDGSGRATSCETFRVSVE